MKLSALVILGALVIPNISFAANACSKNGYTIATINGVFTDENGATANMIALRNVGGQSFNKQSIDYQYLLNNTQWGGAGDVFDSMRQKWSDVSEVHDYDLTEILKSASEKVTTQKVLIVAHSQGNFYANSFYDHVTAPTPSPSGRGGVGFVPPESIGVYSVATPSGRVAGGGRHLTSDTDRVIAGFVGQVPLGTIMPANTHIDLEYAKDKSGHNFSEVYLTYRAPQIVADIQASLDKLQTNSIQNVNGACMNPPELSLFHNIETVAFAVIDPFASLAIKSTGDTASAIANTTSTIARGVGGVVNGVASTITVALFSVPTPIKTTGVIASASPELLFLTGGVPKVLATSAVARVTPPPTPTPAQLAALLRQAQSLQDKMIGLRAQQTEIKATPKPAAPPPPVVKETPVAKPTASVANIFNLITTTNAYQPGFGGGGSGTPIPEVRPQTPPEVSPQNAEEESPAPAATSSAPTDLLAVRGDKTVLLSWFTPTDSGGADITDYEVHESADNFVSDDTTLTDAVSTATSTLVAGLTNGTLYYFRIVAVNSAGTSSPSNIVSATPLGISAAPVMHEGFTPDTHDGINDVIFSWDAPADTGGTPLTNYQFQYSSTSSFALLDHDGLVGPSQTTYTEDATAFTFDIPYYFKVYALNSEGTSVSSNVTNISPGIPPPPPPPPMI